MMVEGRVDVLIQENRLKVDSNNRLLKTMESLRLENIQNYNTIEQQGKEINSLNTLRVTLEKNIANLKQLLEESQNQCYTLERAKVRLDLFELLYLGLVYCNYDLKLKKYCMEIAALYLPKHFY